MGKGLLFAGAGVGIVTVILIATRTKAEPGTATLLGMVTDSIGYSPIPGVEVRLLGTQWSAHTNSNGEYRIINITPGTYDIQFKKEGYQTLVL